MTSKTIRRALGALAALATIASPAQAQWGATLFGTGEYDTNDVILALAGISVSPMGAGWVPVVGVQAFWLRYPSGTSNVQRVSVEPSIGIANNFGPGLFAVRAGYAWEDADEGSAVTGVPVSTGKGATGGAQLEYWGTGAVGAQAIATYNFGSETFWGRGRVLGRVAALQPSGALRVGAELAYLRGGPPADVIIPAPGVGGTTRVAGERFQATSIGPVLEWRSAGGLSVLFGAGQRIQTGDDATYFRIELARFKGP
jgi:hypothetical protein